MVQSRVDVASAESSPARSLLVNFLEREEKELEIDYQIKKLAEKGELVITLLNPDSMKKYYEGRYSLLLPSSILQISFDRDIC